jgi:hypothetical protein
MIKGSKLSWISNNYKDGWLYRFCGSRGYFEVSTAFGGGRDEVWGHVGPHGFGGWGLDSARPGGADGWHSLLREA